MDWMYLFYFFLGAVLFYGAKSAGRGSWNEAYTSREQTGMLKGIAALGVALHHMAQKTAAPWLPRTVVTHGLDAFLSVGYLFVAVFFFCSGLGLYRSAKARPDYLKGFFRRKILPLVLAFYLSEFLYTAVRLLAGEKMSLPKALLYLSGAGGANFNAWFLMVIPFFYLAFWAAFRFCRREGTAIFAVFLFTLGYAAFCAASGWIPGEWWYNSALLFPLGVLFGRFEKPVTRGLKKGWWLWLLLAFAGIFLLSWQSEWLISHRFRDYGGPGDPNYVLHRLLSAGTQWAVGTAFTAFLFLLTMKIRIGNRILGRLGTVSLDFYLVHGIFVEIFGYNFHDAAGAVWHIRNLPLYCCAVPGASALGTEVFRAVRLALTSLTQKREPGAPDRSPVRRFRAWRKSRETADAPPRWKKWVVPAVALGLLAGLFFMLRTGTNEHVRSMCGLEFRVPDGFSLQHGDTHEVIWKYTGEDRKAGYLILSDTIPDAASRGQDSLERIDRECGWLREKAFYTNPQGVRMIRAYTEYAGKPELRYYIETGGGVMIMRMAEDERYYSVVDCETVMRETAEGIRPV